MKNPNQNRKKLTIAALCAFALAMTTLVTAQAQPYEVSLTSSTWTENFDELSGEGCADSLPSGWVMAEGVGLPRYDAPVDTSTTNWTTIAPTNYTGYTVTFENGASGCPHDSGAPTFGGRINLSDQGSSYNNHCIGFQSSNPSWESPTNHIMFGFVNNTGSNIISMAITNNFKQYRLNTTAAMVYFFYSYNGTNWNPLSAGNAGPFATGSSSTYYFASSPLVTPSSFNINNLNLTNHGTFYLDWEFIIANNTGSFSPILGLDDFGLTATYGNYVPPTASVWTNTGGNWSAAANWLNNVVPATDANVTFKGAGGTAFNDLAAVTTGTGSVYSLYFTNGAGAYTITGGALTVNGGITNGSSAAQAIDVPVTMATDETLAATSGALTFSSITNGGYAAIFTGANNITVSGAVTGSGPLTMSGSGILALQASSSYTGATTISSGTLRLAGGSISDSSGVTVNTGATFDLFGNSENIELLSGNGTVTMGAGSLTIGPSGSAGTFGGLISGTGSVTIYGGATEDFTATNTYSGGTILAGATLELGPTAYPGSGPLVLDGGTFQSTGTRSTVTGLLSNEFVLANSTIVQNSTSATAGTRYLLFSGAVVATNGTLTLQNITTGNYTNYMYLGFTGSVTNFTQPIIFDNSLAASQVNNLPQIGAFNTNGTPPQIFSGPISGNGYVIRDGLIAGAGGMMVLSGQSTFGWDVLVDHGYVGFGADSVMSGTNIVTSPAGLAAIQINDDTVNGFPGVGLFAYGGPHTINNNVVLNGVTNTAIIGTNALTLAGTFNPGGLGKILSISNTALTTISGQFTSNAAGLTKAGPGALALTADNTPWPGGWTVKQGTLLANNTTGTATGTNQVVVNGGTLAGTGIIAGTVTVTNNGTIAPGNALGILTLTNGLNLNGATTGNFLWNLGAESTSSAGVNFSQLALTGGALALGGSSQLTLEFTGSASAPTSSDPFWQTTESWLIIATSGSATVSGNFGSIANGAYAAGTFSTSVTGGGVLLTFTPTPSTPNTPVIASFSLSGTNLTIVLTNGSPGGNFSVITSTNVALPLSAWTPITTNTFPANGIFTNILGIATNSPQYFSIKAP